MSWRIELFGVFTGVSGIIQYYDLKRFIKRNEEVLISKIEKRLIRKIVCLFLCSIITPILIGIGLIV